MLPECIRLPGVAFGPRGVGLPSGRAEHQIKAGDPGPRNKLSESSLADLCADFEQHGAGIIQGVREERPQDYLRVVASIIPKDFNIATRPEKAVEMTDAELMEIIALARTGDDDDSVGYSRALTAVGVPTRPNPEPRDRSAKPSGRRSAPGQGHGQDDLENRLFEQPS
jgi:hypothetical protein